MDAEVKAGPEFAIRNYRPTFCDVQHSCKEDNGNNLNPNPATVEPARSRKSPMNTDDLISGLPGERLVRQGLADFQAGLCTIPACLVRIARPRLSRAGLMPQSVPGQFSEPELQLYDLLKREWRRRLFPLQCFGARTGQF